MPKNLTIIFLIILLNLIGLRAAHSANPLVVIEGVGLGVDLLKKGADKVKGAFTKDKDKDKNNGYLKSHEFQFRHYETAEIFFGESAYRFEDARAEAKNKCELKNPQSKQACLEYSYTKVGSKGPLENISYWAQSKKRYLEEYGENSDFTKITEWTEDASNVSASSISENLSEIMSIAKKTSRWRNDTVSSELNNYKYHSITEDYKKVCRTASCGIEIDARTFLDIKMVSEVLYDKYGKNPDEFWSNLIPIRKELTQKYLNKKNSLLVKNDIGTSSKNKKLYNVLFCHPKNSKPSSATVTVWASISGDNKKNKCNENEVKFQDIYNYNALSICVSPSEYTSGLFVGQVLPVNCGTLFPIQIKEANNKFYSEEKRLLVAEKNSKKTYSSKGTGSSFSTKSKNENSNEFKDKLCQLAKDNAVENALLDIPEDKHVYGRKIKVLKERIVKNSWKPNFQKCITTVELTIDETKKFAKEQKPKVVKKVAATKKVEILNPEFRDILNEIDKLPGGNYYVFAHSTAGEKLWGSTNAKNRTTQVGNALSSTGIKCKLTSKQKTKNAPFKGTFDLDCPKEKIRGSWTQDNAYSPGIGQAFTDNGDIITAFFSPNRNVVRNFAESYFKTQSNTQIAKVEKETNQKEFKPKDNKQDNKAPVIKIAKSFKVNEPSYVIEGEVTDQSDRIFIEVEGKTIQAKNGKFKINRFSPIDEEFNIVAIDQWGNRSEPQLVQITVDTSVSLVADKVEPLNPTKIRSKPDRNKIALIIGIEKYEQTPNASFANLDAKYFYEYARNSFGVSKNNIKILVDEDANLIQSLGTLNKWLPGKVKSNQTEVIIFFAGHGLASNNGEELFLLPQDSDPDLLERTALSRNELFESLLKLNPKSVTMFFDTCFSGISRDEKTLLASARPIRITANEQDDVPNNFTIFSASQLDQISSGLKEAKHGIFSYYLMKGLEGDADLNKDRTITNGELLAYMDDNVSQKASELGRQQNPSLVGNPEQVLARY
jgi:hypothetical protein